MGTQAFCCVLKTCAASSPSPCFFSRFARIRDHAEAPFHIEYATSILSVLIKTHERIVTNQIAKTTPVKPSRRYWRCAVTQLRVIHVIAKYFTQKRATHMQYKGKSREGVRWEGNQRRQEANSKRAFQTKNAAAPVAQLF